MGCASSSGLVCIDAYSVNACMNGERRGITLMGCRILAGFPGKWPAVAAAAAVSGQGAGRCSGDANMGKLRALECGEEV